MRLFHIFAVLVILKRICSLRKGCVKTWKLAILVKWERKVEKLERVLIVFLPGFGDLRPGILDRSKLDLRVCVRRDSLWHHSRPTTRRNVELVARALVVRPARKTNTNSLNAIVIRGRGSVRGQALCKWPSLHTWKRWSCCWLMR